MNIPKQSAPIQRTIHTASFSQGNGVEASGTLDDILKVISTVGGIAAPILGGLI